MVPKMKTTAVAEAMICAFSAIFEVLPTRSQRCVNLILDAALADAVIEDVDARNLLESLAVKERSADWLADEPKSAS
jgi:hypothetical protein